MSVEAAEKEEVVESPDIHFQPLVSLPVVDIKTLEEDEEEILKLRAKLFRFDTSDDPPQWKERGVGDVKLLKNRKTLSVRLLMRRDKTHKICANHNLTKVMMLTPSAGSDRAWVWNVMADFADEEPRREQLAIRFKNPEVAASFKEKFEYCQSQLPELDSSNASITEDLEKLTVADKTGDGSPAKGVSTETKTTGDSASNDKNSESSTKDGSEEGVCSKNESDAAVKKDP